MRSTRLCTTTKLYKEMVGFVFGVVLALPTLLFAQIVIIPHEFNPGGVANAEEVNANFTALKNAATHSDSMLNTFGGLGALQSRTTGFANTAFGEGALQNTTTGSRNIAVGQAALSTNTFGNLNTAVGDNALVANTTGSRNIAIGNEALQENTTGSDNIAIGNSAGSAQPGGNNNIYLANDGSGTESNTMRLGGSQTRTTFIAGITGVPVTGSAVLISSAGSSAGQLGIQASSIRYKRDIQPMGAHSRGLLKLRPVIFRYKQDTQGERQYGLIAEEVAKVYPELVTSGANGEVESVRYHEVIPMLLNELQHQQRQLVELQAQNARLRVAVGQQQKRDEAQQAQNAALAARLERLEEAVTRAATLVSR